MSTVVIYNKRWYYRVKKDESLEGNKFKTKALIEDISQKQLENKFVVCYVTPNNIKLFTYFENYTDFGLYSVKFPVEKWCFYECIFGTNAQKLHFDIDITLDNEIQMPTGYDLESLSLLLRNETIMTSIELLQDVGVIINYNTDILLYSSHGQQKRSYHFIINNYCVLSNEEAKGFYEKVIEKIGKKYPMISNKQLKKWIDHAVYSSFQQFRIVGSQKYQSNRPKKLEKKWLLLDKEINHEYIEKSESIEHEFMLQLEESLVSLTNNCNLLPSFLDDKPMKIKSSNIEHIDSVPVEIAKQALELYAKKCCDVLMTDYRFPYKILKIQGGLILLKRLKPSKCKICQKNHEHENPYLILVKNNNGFDVFFNCRRSDTNLPVGHLSPEASIPLPLDVGQVHSIDEKGFPFLDRDPKTEERSEELTSDKTDPTVDINVQSTEQVVETKSVLERINEISDKITTSDEQCSIKQPIGRQTVKEEDRQKLRSMSKFKWSQAVYGHRI